MALTAKEILDTYETYRDLRQSHLRQVELDQDFILGKQWTKEEETELSLRGQSALVINRILPVIMQEQAILCANNPEFRVVAREDGDVEVAKIGNELLSYIQDINDFQLLFPQIVYDFLVNGVGYAYVFKKDTPEGEEVGIEHLRYRDVLVDPYSKKPDFSDAEAIQISKFLTRKMFQRLYPEKANVLNKVQKDFENTGRYKLMHDEHNLKHPEDIYDPDRDMFRVIEHHYIEKVPSVRVFDTTNGTAKYYKKKEFKTLMEEEGFKQAVLTGAYSVKDVKVNQSYKDVVVGTEKIYNKVELPSSMIPIIPFTNLHIGSPFAIGDVRFLRGIQREINKRRSLLIAHAATSMASKLLIEQGSVEDIEEVERKNARPGGVIEYAPGFNPPEQSQVSPLPNGLYQLEEMAAYDLEFLAGIFSLQQGSTKDAPETFRATLAIEEFGNRRLNLKLRSISNGLSRLGKVAWEYMQKTYDYDKVIRIVNPNTGDEELLRLGLVDSFDESGIGKVFDVTAGRYDIKCVAGSTMASNRWAEAQEYKEWYQLGIIDREEVLKKTDIFDKKGILERTGTVEQLSAQLEQLSEGVEQAQKEISARDNKIRGLLEQLVKAQFQIKELSSSSNDEESGGK